MPILTAQQLLELLEGLTDKQKTYEVCVTYDTGTKDQYMLTPCYGLKKIDDEEKVVIFQGE